MTFNIWSAVVIALAIVGAFAGWRLSIYIGRLLIVVWRLGIAACFAVLAIYVLSVAWPHLVRLQESGQIHFPGEIAEWRVVQ